MNFFRHRQPKGLAIGGQFAATAHSEAEISLAQVPAAGIGYGDTADMHGTALGIFRDALRSHRNRMAHGGARRSGKPLLTSARGRAAVAAFVLAASAVSLTACSYSGDATVESKTHTASHTELGTASNGKYSWPTTRHVPEAWTVTVRGADGRTFPVKVDQNHYDSLEQGETVRVNNDHIAD